MLWTVYPFGVCIGTGNSGIVISDTVLPDDYCLDFKGLGPHNHAWLWLVAVPYFTWGTDSDKQYKQRFYRKAVVTY